MKKSRIKKGKFFPQRGLVSEELERNSDIVGLYLADGKVAAAGFSVVPDGVPLPDNTVSLSGEGSWYDIGPTFDTSAEKIEVEDRSSSSPNSVGYSRPYADNYDAIFRGEPN